MRAGVVSRVCVSRAQVRGGRGHVCGVAHEERGLGKYSYLFITNYANYCCFFFFFFFFVFFFACKHELCLGITNTTTSQREMHKEN